MTKLTPAQMRALDVVATCYDQARESNSTDPGRGHIYWQTREALTEKGLIEIAPGSLAWDARYRLTVAGEIAVSEAQLQ